MPETSSVCNVDTLTLFPDAIPYPKMDTEDYLQQSAQPAQIFPLFQYDFRGYP